VRVPFWRLVFARLRLSCLGLALDGMMPATIKALMLAAAADFSALVVRTFFVRLTVRPSGTVRRVGWHSSQEVATSRLAPWSSAAAATRYAWAPSSGARMAPRSSSWGLAGYSQSPADCSARVRSACRMLNGLTPR
jgi:hypothetical protein